MLSKREKSRSRAEQRPRFLQILLTQTDLIECFNRWPAQVAEAHARNVDDTRGAKSFRAVVARADDLGAWQAVAFVVRLGQWEGALLDGAQL